MGAESAALTHAPAKHAKQPAKEAAGPAAARHTSIRLREGAPPAGIAASNTTTKSFASIPPLAPGERSPALQFNHSGLRLPPQRKLAVGAVSDPLEHEADTMAQQILSMPHSAPHAISSGAHISLHIPGSIRHFSHMPLILACSPDGRRWRRLTKISTKLIRTTTSRTRTP